MYSLLNSVLIMKCIQKWFLVLLLTSLSYLAKCQENNENFKFQVSFLVFFVGFLCDFANFPRCKKFLSVRTNACYYHYYRVTQTESSRISDWLGFRIFQIHHQSMIKMIHLINLLAYESRITTERQKNKEIPIFFFFHTSLVTILLPR